MIERQAERDGVTAQAWYSPCGTFRYGLRRRWGPGAEVLFVMLNPSTATEQANDPTIARCQRRAALLGFAGLRVANLFAFRATQPRDLRKACDPEGPENAGLLSAWAKDAAMVVAGWGVHGALNGQGAYVARQLTGDVRHLGLTRDGHPRHPLYVAYAHRPEPWPMASRYPAASGQSSFTG